MCEGSEWVKFQYKTLSMWHCVAYIRTVPFELNICIHVFAISSGFICEVVMARTYAFCFQIINSLIDTWPGLTVNLLICFIPVFSLRSNNWKICPKYTFHQESSLALNLNRNLKKKLVMKNPKKKLFQAWIPSQEKLTNWWRYLNYMTLTQVMFYPFYLWRLFFSFFLSVWPGAFNPMNDDEIKRKEIIWVRLCNDVKLTQS